MIFKCVSLVGFSRTVSHLIVVDTRKPFPAFAQLAGARTHSRSVLFVDGIGVAQSTWRWVLQNITVMLVY